LFNALHATSVIHRSPSDVIPIADVYRRKQGLQAMHILLAEDNPVNQEVILEVLQRAGHHAQVVDDGEKTLDALAGDETFDLILLDMNMPAVSGLDVLKQFRFMDTSAATPVVMLSADALPETVKQCKEAGANDYLTKPVDASLLLETVAQYAPSPSKQSGKKNPPQQATMDDIDKVLDLERLDELAAILSTPGKLAGLIQTLEDTGQAHLSELEAAARDGNKTRFLDEVHAFKGAAATLGVIRVAALCREIEGARGGLNNGRMLHYKKKLESAFRVSRDSLHAYLETRLSPEK